MRFLGIRTNPPVFEVVNVGTCGPPHARPKARISAKAGPEVCVKRFGFRARNNVGEQEPISMSCVDCTTAEHSVIAGKLNATS